MVVTGSTWVCVLHQFAALWAMVTMGTAPVKVLHCYYYYVVAIYDPKRKPWFVRQEWNTAVAGPRPGTDGHDCRTDLDHLLGGPSALLQATLVCDLYCIGRHIYLNLSKSTQSTAGLKALKPAANRCFLTSKSLPCYFHLLYRSTINKQREVIALQQFDVKLYRSTFILPSGKCMLGLFMFP